MMNLATRCTACGTIFRVVQDQLKVSDGWVRCGRCQAVFNAQQGLFDLEREAPPPWQPAAAAPELTADEEASPAPESIAAATDEAAPEAESAPDEHEWRHDPPAPSDTLTPPQDERFGPASETPSEPAVETESSAYTDTPPAHDDSLVETDAAAVEGAEVEPGEPTEGRPLAVEATESKSDEKTDEAVAATTLADDDSTPSTPDFVRQAERDERWEQTPVRAALVGLAVAAALGLALQITGHYRQRIAAQWPESTPWLLRYCATFGCRLDALRRIDDVSIESTALTQADASVQDDSTPNALRLAVSLRNRGELAVAMPSVDLSLTGADGELVARRSLSPADFQVSDPRLKPGVEAPLSVTFSVAGPRVTGYTVEVFYP